MAAPAERVPESLGHLHTAVETCEWCEQPIPPDRLQPVRGRIAARERALWREATEGLRQDFARERTDEASRHQAELAAIRAEADRQGVERALAARAEGTRETQALADQREKELQDRLVAHESRQAESEQALSSLTAELMRVRTEDVAAAREAGRAQAVSENDSALRDALQRLAEAQTQIVEVRAAAGRLQTEVAEREKAARELGAHEVQATTDQLLTDLKVQLTQANERASEAEAARRDTEHQLQASRLAHESALQQRLREQRDALSKDKDQALRDSDARAFAKQQKLQETVDSLTRQVQQMSAHDLGEGAEINLYDALKAAFESDRIRRVPKGTPGADHIHEVMQHGKVAGRIVYDTKNRNDYKSEYAKKLRGDQIAARADFAVLATNRFPKNARQLHLDSKVILASPARVVVIAAILRQHILQVHALRLSNEEREAKTEILYKYINSEPCRQLLESIDKLVRDLQEIDVAEKRAHSSIWEKRGKLLASVLKANGDLCSSFERIIGTRD
jgi:hypothetical protein